MTQRLGFFPNISSFITRSRPTGVERSIASIIHFLPKRNFEIGKNLIEYAKHHSRRTTQNPWTRNVKSLIENDSLTVLKMDRFFQGLGPKSKLSIVKLCIEKSPDESLKNFSNFGIITESERLELVKWLVHKNPALVAKYFPHFEISCQMEIRSIALTCAKRAPFAVAAYFKRFGLSNSRDHFSLAVTCMKGAPGTVAKHHLQNFEPLSSKQRYMLAKLCADHDPKALAEHFKNFGLENPEDRFCVAQRLIRGPSKDSYPLYQSDNKNIPDFAYIVGLEEERSFAMALYFQNFNLTNQRHCTLIAKQCMERNALATLTHFQNFGLRNPEHIFEIAKICAKKNARFTAENFQNFRLEEDPKRCLEIAKLCAEQDPEMIVNKYFQNFGLNSSGRVALAKFCTEKDPSLEWMANLHATRLTMC